MRLQLALNVPDLEAAVSYYGKLFDTPPHKLRKGMPTSPSTSRRLSWCCLKIPRPMSI